MTKEEFIEKLGEIRGKTDDELFAVKFEEIVHNILAANTSLHKEVVILHQALNEIRDFIYKNRANDNTDDLYRNNNSILQIIEQTYMRLTKEVIR